MEHCLHDKLCTTALGPDADLREIGAKHVRFTVVRAGDDVQGFLVQGCDSSKASDVWKVFDLKLVLRHPVHKVWDAKQRCQRTKHNELSHFS